MTERAFYEEPLALFSPDNFTKFFPYSGMNVVETANAVVRLATYISITNIIVGGSVKSSLILLLLVIGCAYVALYRHDQEGFVENGRMIYNNEVRRAPTINNPLMNPMMFETGDQPDAADPTDPEIAKLVDRAIFNKGEDPNTFNNRIFRRTMTTLPKHATTFTNYTEFGDYLMKGLDLENGRTLRAPPNLLSGYA